MAGGTTFNGTLAGFNVALGEYVTMTATRTDALVPTQFFETSEFSAAYLAAAVFDISGTIFEDVDGDSVDGAAPADWVGRDNVRVRLFRDTAGGGAGTPDASDQFVTSVLTGAGGTYTFANQAAGTYWVVVDSRTITPSAGTSIANQVWAEQTYGTAGAWGGGLTPTGVLATSGALYGGRSATNSDNSADAPGSLANSDHVTRVNLAAADVAGVDSAFSFNVVTNVRGDGLDDEGNGANPRLQQGSLHQFILNANATNGANAMVFVPAVNANVDGGNGLGNGNDYWRVSVTSALNPITGANTTIDGTAYSFTYGTVGVAVRDDNTGLLGAGGTVGVGGLPLSQVARPELEIVDGAAAGVIDYGFRVQAADVTIRDLAIYGFGEAAVPDDPANISVVGDAYDRVVITGNLIGFSAGAATFTAADADPGAGARSERHGIHIEDADDGLIQNNLIGFVGHRGITLRGTTGYDVVDNEIRGVGQWVPNGWWYDAIDVTGASSNALIEGNLLTGNRSPGIDINNGATTGITVVNNTITNNATAGSGEEFGVGVRNASNVVVDRNVISGNAGAGVYVVRNNAGTTTALVTGNQITGNTGVGVLVEESGGGTTTATITQNVISGNGSLGIDLGNNGVTANDLSASWVGTNHDPDGGANELQNFPVISSASSNGTTVTLNWSLEGSGSNFYRVEFFASATADPSGNGEGQVYLGARDIQTTNGSYSTIGDLFNVAVTPGWVITATATRVDALVPTQFFETSEFSAAVGTASISGKLWEDVNGNGAIVDDGVGVNLVDVRLYRDNPSAGTVGAPDAADILVGSAITGGGGLYAFSNLATGTYWTVVDSRTFTLARRPSSQAGVAGQNDIWAEQTYGVTGAMNGPASFLGATGALFGGRNAAISDNAFLGANINAPEHVTRVVLAGASAAAVDSAFSFNAVVNTRGDAADDDATAGALRVQQGSLRQFILNANEINGANAMRFVPVVATNEAGSGGNWWTINVAAVLPTISGANTTIDGTAYYSTSGVWGPAGVTVRDANAGQVGTGGTVGVDGIALATVARPELELAGGNLFTGPGLRVAGSSVTIQNLAVNGFGATMDSNQIQVDATVVGLANRAVITGNLVGTNADGTNPGAGTRENVGIFTNGAALITNNYVAYIENNGLMMSLAWLGTPNTQPVTVTGNEIAFNQFLAGFTGDAVSDVPSNAVVTGNYIHDFQGPVTLDVRQGKGIEVWYQTQNALIENNTITGMRVAGIGINDGSNNNTIRKNIITGTTGVAGGGGAGILVTSFDDPLVVSPPSTGDLITQNSIYGNFGLGIDLDARGPAFSTTYVGDGVTLNDGGDVDTGGNGLQNFPVLFGAGTDGAGNVTVAGRLNSTANTTFRIEFFSTPAADAAADGNPTHGEGRYYLGFVDVTTDGSGNVAFSGTFARTVAVGDVVTATATNLRPVAPPSSRPTSPRWRRARSPGPSSTTPMATRTWPRARAGSPARPSSSTSTTATARSAPATCS